MAGAQAGPVVRIELGEPWLVGMGERVSSLAAPRRVELRTQGPRATSARRGLVATHHPRLGSGSPARESIGPPVRLRRECRHAADAPLLMPGASGGSLRLQAGRRAARSVDRNWKEAMKLRCLPKTDLARRQDAGVARASGRYGSPPPPFRNPSMARFLRVSIIGRGAIKPPRRGRDSSIDCPLNWLTSKR